MGEVEKAATMDEQVVEPTAEPTKSWCVVAQGVTANKKTWLVVEHGLTRDDAEIAAAKASEQEGVSAKAVAQPKTVTVRAYDEVDGELVANESEAARKLGWDEAVAAIEADNTLRMVWSPWTVGKKVAIGIGAALVVVGVVAGVAFGMTPASTPEAEAPKTVTSQSAPAAKEDEKKAEKSEVMLTIKAEGAEAGATKAKVVAADEKGETVVEEREVEANTATSLGKLDEGDYELYVTAAPVCDDGSTYELPADPIKFTVKGDGKDVAVECALTKMAKEDMSKEQLEAAATILESAGKTEAAETARSAASTAASKPGSASSVQQAAPVTPPSNSGGGNSGTTSSGGNNGGSSNSGGSTPTTPSTPAHQHDQSVPVYGTVHHDAVYQTVYHDAQVQQVPVYGDKCGACGAINPSWEHSKQHDLNGENGNVLNNVVVGYEERVVTPAWSEEVLVSAAWDETVITGYKCSCGA